MPSLLWCSLRLSIRNILLTLSLIMSPHGLDAADLYGKTVEVFGTGTTQLRAWTGVCSGAYVTKPDSTRGLVLSASSQSCDGYNRWQIRWPGDATDRWSAENWLRVVPPNLTVYSSVSRSPSSVTPGNALRVSCDIANLGEGNARSSTTKILILNATTLAVVLEQDFIETSAILPGYYIPFSYDITIPANTPAGNYFARVEVDSQGDIGQTVYTDDLKDSSTFTVVPVYTVTASAGDGGSVDPNGAQAVSSGGSIKFTAIPDQSYGVNQWSVDGSLVQTGGASYQLSNVTANRTVNVSFVRVYNLTLHSDGQGSCTVSPPGGKYAAGTRVTVIATPLSGNQFSEWQGSSQSGRSSTFAFDMGGSDEVITAKFVPILSPANISLVTAGSTPATIGIPVPTAPSWFTFVEGSSVIQPLEWKILAVVQGNGSVVNYPLSTAVGSCYVRFVQFPKVTTAPFLEFPLKGNSGGPTTWPVTAVFDHSKDLANVIDTPVIGPYVHDGTIRNTIGATSTVPTDRRGESTAPARITEGDLTSLFNYQHTSWLYYDGHVGYDFRADETTDVYAAEGGEVVTGGGADNCGAKGLAIADLYMKYRHALIIKHPNDYCTVYMHLSAIDSQLADTTNWDHWKPKTATVVRGQKIGKAGNYLRNCSNGNSVPLTTHLHFEVWRKENDKWYFADPYGYQYNGNIVTPYLWVQP